MNVTYYEEIAEYWYKDRDMVVHVVEKRGERTYNLDPNSHLGAVGE